MKLLLLAPLLLSLLGPHMALGQQGQLSGQILEGNGPAGFPGVTITLQRADTLLAGTMAGSNGAFTLPAVPVGTYDLVLQMVGYRTERLVGVQVTLQAKSLVLPFPGPCLYTYTKHQRPICPAGHMDHLIPMVYGLPSKHTMQRASQGKVHLAGCEVTGCDPRYYCPIHQKEL
jgi:hypothetical protein